MDIVRMFNFSDEICKRYAFEARALQVLRFQLLNIEVNLKM